MLGADFMPTQVKQIGHSGMYTEKSLGLSDRLEFPHTPLSYPGSLVRLLCTIILILPAVMDNFPHQLTMRYSIAA